MANVVDRGGIGGGDLDPDPVPEVDNTEIGVMGQAADYPVAGFNTTGMQETRRTYGLLGANNAIYGGYMGAFGRGEDYGGYFIGTGGPGIFACSGSGGSTGYCAANEPASNYGLYATIDGNLDAIKGECANCSSAVAGVHTGNNGVGLYGEGLNNAVGAYAGWFNGQVFIGGNDWQDAEDIGVVIGGSEKSGDSIRGTKNLWLWAGDGTVSDEPSVRVKDKLEVRGDLAVNGDHVKLADGQDCSGLAAPSGGGAWVAMGTINYLRPPAPGTSAYKTLCVVTTGISW